MYNIKKHGFNLVEITLAVAVLAIGMSSILVLFPVGVNSHKEAVANNNLSDISEYILGAFETKIMEDWAGRTNGTQYDVGADGKVTAFNQYAASTSGFIHNSLPTTATSGEDTKDLVPGNSIEGFRETDAATKDQWKRAKFFFTGKTGVFLYEQSTLVDDERVPDFSAVVRTWREPVKLALNDGVETAIDNSYNYAISVNLEISWPAEAPYDQREKRFYKLDLFNPYYTPVTPANP